MLGSASAWGVRQVLVGVIKQCSRSRDVRDDCCWLFAMTNNRLTRRAVDLSRRRASATHTAPWVALVGPSRRCRRRHLVWGDLSRVTGALGPRRSRRPAPRAVNGSITDGLGGQRRGRDRGRGSSRLSIRQTASGDVVDFP